MARRPSLSADPLPKRRAAHVEAQPATKTIRPPSRQDQHAITIWISAEVKEQLRTLGFNQNRTKQDLGEEALNLLFAEHGLHRIAGVKPEPE